MFLAREQWVDGRMGHVKLMGKDGKKRSEKKEEEKCANERKKAKRERR